jgi:hypothetical protein
MVVNQGGGKGDRQTKHHKRTWTREIDKKKGDDANQGKQTKRKKKIIISVGPREGGVNKTSIHDTQ